MKIWHNVKRKEIIHKKSDSVRVKWQMAVNNFDYRQFENSWRYSLAPNGWNIRLQGSGL